MSGESASLEDSRWTLRALTCGVDILKSLARQSLLEDRNDMMWRPKLWNEWCTIISATFHKAVTLACSWQFSRKNPCHLLVYTVRLRSLTQVSNVTCHRSPVPCHLSTDHHFIQLQLLWKTQEYWYVLEFKKIFSTTTTKCSGNLKTFLTRSLHPSPVKIYTNS